MTATIEPASPEIDIINRLLSMNGQTISRAEIGASRTHFLALCSLAAALWAFRVDSGRITRLFPNPIRSGLPTILELSRGWLKSKCRVLPLAVRLGDGKRFAAGLRGFPLSCVEKDLSLTLQVHGCWPGSVPSRFALRRRKAWFAHCPPATTRQTENLSS